MRAGAVTTTAPPAPAPETPPPPPRAPLALLALLRNTWRGLTSMRTALVLLFLLALAAVPGALLPQRVLNQRLVDNYMSDHPVVSPWFDRLQLFDLFSSPWFGAIYLLLMISLVGCLLPRTVEQARALRAPAVATPRNLARLPHHAEATVPDAPADVEARVRRLVPRWHAEWRDEPGGVRTLSAERGQLREFGNLAFHMSVLGLLVAFATGKIIGYEGQVIVLANGGEFCNTGILGYDSFRPGLRVDGTQLQPFCVRVGDFRAVYEPNGQAASYSADIEYQTAADIAAGTTAWRSDTIAVNNPLRTDGSRLYLLGHGYSPRFTVTWPDGAQRTGDVQWRPNDLTTMLSEGATKFARPGVTDEQQRRASQIAITGLLAPTTSGGDVVTSVFPAPDDPEVAVDVLRGDIGLDDGRGQSIFSVDRSGLDDGTLTQVARKNMRPGDEITLDDGTRIRFDGLRNWVSLQVSHDPAQVWVLVFAVTMLGGLMLSLAVRRRRFWVRLTPRGDGTHVELGGLARTDRAGYGEEFDRLRADLLERSPEDKP